MVGLSLIGYWVIRPLSYRAKILTCLLLIICLLGISFILPNSIKERAASIVKVEATWRLYVWQGAIKMIQDRPIFGHGVGSFMDIYGRYQGMGTGAYAHNCFLQMAAEIGIVGLVCFIWILVRFFRLGFRTLKERKDSLLLGLLAGIFAFLVHSFFDTNLYSLQLAVLFWFMLGLAVSIQRITIQNSL